MPGDRVDFVSHPDGSVEDVRAQKQTSNLVLRRRAPIRVYCFFAGVVCGISFIVKEPNANSMSPLGYLAIVAVAYLVMAMSPLWVVIAYQRRSAIPIVCALLAFTGLFYPLDLQQANMPRELLMLATAYVLLGLAVLAFLFGGEVLILRLLFWVAVGGAVIWLNMKYPQRVADQVPPLIFAAGLFLHEHFLKIRVGLYGLQRTCLFPFPQSILIAWDQVQTVESYFSRDEDGIRSMGSLVVVGNGNRISINTTGFSAEVDSLRQIADRARNPEQSPDLPGEPPLVV